MLALHRTTHHTLHALSGALADLNLGAAEINALANLADRGALNVRELSAEKLGGQVPPKQEERRPAQVINLMDALKASLANARQKEPAEESAAGEKPPKKMASSRGKETKARKKKTS